MEGHIQSEQLTGLLMVRCKYCSFVVHISIILIIPASGKRKNCYRYLEY